MPKIALLFSFHYKNRETHSLKYALFLAYFFVWKKIYYLHFLSVSKRYRLETYQRVYPSHDNELQLYGFHHQNFELFYLYGHYSFYQDEKKRYLLFALQKPTIIISIFTLNLIECHIFNAYGRTSHYHTSQTNRTSLFI